MPFLPLRLNCLSARSHPSLTHQPPAVCVLVCVCVWCLCLYVHVHTQVCPISSAPSAGLFEPDQKQHNWARTLKCSFQELTEERNRRVDQQRGKQTAVLLHTPICPLLQLLQLLHNPSILHSFSVCSLSWMQEVFFFCLYPD